MSLGFVIALGVIALLLLVVGIVVTVRSERSLVEERLGRYLDDEPAGIDEGADKEKSSFLTDWLTSMVEGTSLGDKISKELARADLKFRPGEYVATQFIAAFVTFATRSMPQSMVIKYEFFLFIIFLTFPFI